jgi:class 3 adenylate cyclase/predicted ATPase
MAGALTSREPERRQLTVLFCDLVGSTALAGQLDLEDYREMVQAYSETCAAVIARFDGHIAQYLGDGLLVYFGYPQAHEDDAQRAVWAGLGLLEAIAALSPSLALPPGERLSVRLGIHTGSVVIDAVGASEHHASLALGETPNIAARLQHLAEPDMLLISAATYTLIMGYFHCKALGAHTLRGMTRQIELYEVQGASRTQSRFEAVVARGLTPLVGRQEELGLLQQRWALATEGEGQVVQLNGEAGIGKSRLAETLCERLADVPHLRLHYQCSPYHSNSAFYPFVIQLEWMIQREADVLDENQLDRLEVLLTQADIPVADNAPLLAGLLSIPIGDRYPPMSWSPQRRKEQTIEALVALLVGLSQQEPVVAIAEDVHWIDPTSLETLARMVERVQDARVLLVITARPEFVSPWADYTHVTSYTLNRLSRRQVTAMVEQITGGKPLPREVVDQILDKTDGMPLFVEELTKSILESGLLLDDGAGDRLRGALPSLAIPSTLQDALMARLDRLAPTAKEAAQMGSVLGREFADALLAAISPLSQEVLRDAVQQLIAAGLLFRRGASADVTYRFKHALVQEVSYGSLLRQRRLQLHARAAQMLETRFAARVETEPEVVAHHYTEAGDAARAIPYWRRAGHLAAARSAHVEAISHLTTGLEALSMLPDSPARARDELGLQRALGASLIAARGFAAAEVEQTYIRAQELCRQVHDTEQLFPVLFGLWGFYNTRHHLRKGREMAEHLIALAQHDNDPALLVPGYRALGETFFHLGELVQARAYLERALSLYDPEQHRTHALLYGHDAGVSCLGFGARTLWLLGYPDRALQRSREAVALAQSLSHPFSLSFAILLLIHLHHHRREAEMVLRHAETLITLATEQGFPQGIARGLSARGWALTAQGHPSEGIAQLRQGVVAYQDAGFQVSLPYDLAWLAEALGKNGEVEEGLHLMAEALALIEHSGPRCYEPELHRIQGELLQSMDSGFRHEGTPETCFHRALDIARRQQAKSLELRTALSLSRLWHQQGRQDEARNLLAPIYGWFTEGLDTPDLQDARALLEMLSRST